MNFALSEDQVALRDATRRFLGGRVRREPEPGLWERVTGELGWAAVAIPEAYGGLDLGPVEVAVLMEEMGRTLLPVPFFSSIALGANALLVAGSDQQKSAWLPDLAAGTRTAALAVEGVRLSSSGLQGTARVVDGHTADLVIVATEDALVVVPWVAAGLTRRALPTMDTTRTLSELRFEGVAATEVLPGGRAALVTTLHRAAAALAAESLGVAEACLAMAVDYARVRRQFGRPIGSFQAIKHKCADMLVRVEAARSAAWYAAWAAAEAPEELPLAAAMARSTCSEAAFHCAAENIQIHGGIGFTWEHDAHLFFKRARASEALLGTPARHREDVALALGW